DADALSSHTKNNCLLMVLKSPVPDGETDCGIYQRAISTQQVFGKKYDTRYLAQNSSEERPTRKNRGNGEAGEDIEISVPCFPPEKTRRCPLECFRVRLLLRLRLHTILG